MRVKLGAVKYVSAIEEANDIASLLREIKGILYKYDGYCNPYFTLDDTKLKFYSCYPRENEPNTLHVNTFKAFMNVV